ncbi:MAG: LysR family transcriptional regulator, partial [Gammaproteobacteria bacterium]|nr:LysR family transcriptional regulator [Gammaproteobacteria bacterium]
INLARSGAGIVGIHTGLAKTMSELEPILEWMPLPKLEFWIVSHGDTQFNARIRALKVFLSDWFCEDPYKHIIL